MGKKKSKKGGGGSSSKGKSKGKRLEQKPRIPMSITSGPVDNPFEMRVNKRKHDNLGRRGRNELGVPGISRGKAIEKRNKTLLQEYKVRNKSSVLQDNRIGEKRKGMPEEEKIIRRSAAEKARQFKQKSIFNLQDTDEFLTHRGEPLVDVDRYEDPRDASDSEDERLDADFVSDANFGGFMRIKKPEEEEPNEEDFKADGQPKSHKEIIHELIMASKQKKYEKAKEADENYELVCKLDEDFKNPDIKSLLFGVAKDKPPQEKSIPPPSSAPTAETEYDKLVKELQFETKTGKAAERLKTEDEVADETKEKLEQLERDRLRRMQMTDTDGNLKHRSADDLDDGFYLADVNKNSENDKESEEGESSDGDEDEDVEEEEDDGSDSYDDLESDSESESVGTKKPLKKHGNVDKGAEKVVSNQPSNDFSTIPFVMGVPIKYKEFESLLKKYRAHYTSCGGSSLESTVPTFDVILSRIIKYNTAADRSKLPQLFNYIVRYALEATEVYRVIPYESFICKVIIPHLQTLLVLSPSDCMESVEKGELFDDFYPLNDLPLFKILYFDLCSKLFCCTDFHHHVLSPVKAKLLEVLAKYKVSDSISLCKGFYVIDILYQLSSESRRYSPEIVIWIGSILQCFTGNSLRPTGFIIPCLRSAREFLFISPDENRKCTVSKVMWQNLYNGETSMDCDTGKKFGFVLWALDLAIKFIQLYERLPSSKEVFAPMRKTLSELKNQDWPKVIVEKIESVINEIDKLKKTKEALAITTSSKPKPLRLYEPLVEEDFDGMRKKKVPKGKQETARLAHKVKQEMKSAVREIRKDTAFLATQQLREQIEKDSERKRKVKEIMGSLANQEGEYQKSKRGKK